MVFNGEIYNFQDLKDMLPNHTWRTQSDSEVIIELLNHFGKQALSYFNGMYAIAWYKKSTGEFILARDPLGIKPLYLHTKDKDVFFASELTALTSFGVVPEICRTDFVEFLNFGFVHEPRTGFSNVSKVAPGQCLIWERGVYRKETIGDFRGPPNIPQDPYHLILHAIQGQKKADVPVGTFFSGGVDSTAVAATLKSQGLYINGFKDREKNRELIRARKLAKELGIKLDVSDLNENITPDQFRNDLNTIIAKVEEPISDYTFVASQQIARLARQSGFVVMLSGMGGDEFFAGYPRYALLNRLWLYRWVSLAVRLGLKLPGLRNVLGQSKKIERLVSYFREKDFVWAYARVIGYFTTAEINELLESDLNLQARNTQILTRLTKISDQAVSQDPLDRALALDQKGFLAHNLTVTDKSSMQESIEVRVPLLDLSIYMGWVKNTALRKKFPRVGKAALLTFVNRVLGRQIDFGTKQGFNPPLDKIISQFDRAALEQMILTPAFEAFLNPTPVRRILDDHFSGRINNTYKIWQLIFSAHWLQYWSIDKVK